MQSRRQRIWVRFLSVFILLAGLAMYFLLARFKPRPTPQVKSSPTMVVHSTVLEQGTQPRNVLLYGTVKSQEHATLSARVNSVVDTILVRDGARVKKGQLLLQLSHTGADLVVKQAKAEVQDKRAQLTLKTLSLSSNQQALAHREENLAISERQLKRLESLSSKQYVSAETLDKQRANENSQVLHLKTLRREIAVLSQQIQQAKASLASAEARLDDANNKRGHTRVIAPFDGVITQMFAATGEHVNIGVPLLDIMSSQDVEVRAMIPASELSQLDIASLTKLKASARLYGHELSLQFSRLSGQVKSGQVGTEAIFIVKNPPLHLKRGQVMLVKFALPAQPKAYSIPLSALYGNDKVYVIKNGRLARRTVKVVGHFYHTIDVADLVVVGADLVSGESLLSNQVPGAVDGLKVTSGTG